MKEELTDTVMKRVLFWAPRILCILFAMFVSVFALDVFGEGYSFGQTVAALLLHLVPTYIVVIMLIIAWRWEWVGAVLFSTLAAFYVVLFWGRFPLIAYLFISGPLLLIGALFMLNRIYRL